MHCTPVSLASTFTYPRLLLCECFFVLQILLYAFKKTFLFRLHCLNDNATDMFDIQERSSVKTLKFIFLLWLSELTYGLVVKKSLKICQRSATTQGIEFTYLRSPYRIFLRALFYQ